MPLVLSSSGISRQLTGFPASHFLMFGDDILSPLVWVVNLWTVFESQNFLIAPLWDLLLSRFFPALCSSITMLLTHLIIFPYFPDLICTRLINVVCTCNAFAPLVGRHSMDLWCHDMLPPWPLSIVLQDTSSVQSIHPMIYIHTHHTNMHVYMYTHILISIYTNCTNQKMLYSKNTCIIYTPKPMHSSYQLQLLPHPPIIFSQPGGPRFRGTAIKAEAPQFSVTSPKLWNSKHITTAWVNPWPGGVVPSGGTTLGGKDSQFYSDKKHHPQIPQYDCRKSGL